MAIGLWVQIQSNQSEQVNIPAGNYLWPTIRVMNPNDGVAYVKLNAPIVNTGIGAWDYKVPAQSFGILPSEGQGWQSVGVLYQDQSGTNRPGELAFYLSQANVTDPSFVAIGRSLVTQSSSVDIGQGSQPANPGAGYSRLWIDTLGHLNILQPNGGNFVVLDNTNYSTVIVLAGDVIGPVGNTTISMRNASWAMAHDSSGNLVDFFAVWSDNNVYFNLPTNGGQYIFRNLGNAVAATLTATGSLNVPGVLSAGASLGSSAGDISANRGNGSGVIFLGSASRYLFYDGTNYQLPGTNLLVANGAVQAQGLSTTNNVVWFTGLNSAQFLQWDGTYIRIIPDVYSGTALLTGRLVTQNWDTGVPNSLGGAGGTGGQVTLDAYFGIHAMRGWADTSANSNAFVAPNIGDNRGQGLAYQWNTWSSVDHASQYNQRIDKIIDATGKVRAITGVSYDHISFGNEQPDDNPGPPKQNVPIHKADGSFTVTPLYGFSAKDVEKTLPELVSVNEASGQTEIIDLDRMLVVLWEAVKEIDARVTKLEPAPA